MSKTTNRWDNFTPWELQALDEFFKSFGHLRESNPDIGKLAGEVAASLERREIPPFDEFITRDVIEAAAEVEKHLEFRKMPTKTAKKQ
jgi:hypothetical protein